MSKLNLNTATQRLAEADEMRAVAVANVKKPDSTPGLVKVKDPSMKLTRVTSQPKPTMQKSKENAKGGLNIPTAEFGGDIVDKAPKMTFKNSKHGTDGAVRVPSAKTVKGATSINPAHRQIGNTIKRTEAGAGFGQDAEFLDGSPSANEIILKFGKGLKSGSNHTPTVKKVTPAHIGPESPKPGKVSIKQPPEHKTIPQVKKPSGFMADPSDAGSRNVTIAKESVRSGITVRLGNKVKTHFNIVNMNVLERMVESYRQHGYELTVVANGKAVWKRDRTLLKTIWESLDAEFNFVPEYQQKLRRAALNRFSAISQSDYNSLYESRQEFVDTLVGGFNQIEKSMRRRYTESLELMLCNVRFIVGGRQVEAEITTEAHSQGMALRQIRNLLQEQYGLDTKLVHVFVDGKKFSGSQIAPWTPTNESEEECEDEDKEKEVIGQSDDSDDSDDSDVDSEETDLKEASRRKIRR